MAYLRLIEQDLFDIATRLKEIDGRYELYYNPAQERFEVHTARGMEVVLPEPTLDARAIEHVKKTRLENLKHLVEEIDAHNLKLEKDNLRRVLDNAASLEEELWK